MTDPTLKSFLSWTDQEVFELIRPKKLNLSISFNSTRRWFISTHFDTPPTDENYHPELLEFVIAGISKTLRLITNHGVYRVFMPAYSAAQHERDAVAHTYLIKGLQMLHNHPVLLSAYKEMECQVHFTGDLSFLPDSSTIAMREFSQKTLCNKKSILYYDMHFNNPYSFLFKLMHEFISTHGQQPTWEDMLEMYYGDKNVGSIHIIINPNRLYARVGLPPLMGGLFTDRIYATATSPLVLTATALRKILYDYIYNKPVKGINYRNIDNNELKRLKIYYEANKDTVIGLTCRYNQLIYPYNELVWPSELGPSNMDNK